MKYFTYLIPLLFVILFIYCKIKKISVYDNFIGGVKKSLPLVVSIFPYLVGIFIMTELFSASGLSEKFIKVLSPVFSFLHIPKELAPLVIIKPFSGSGSLAVLSDIFATYGVDSFIARTACAIYGSSETIFYISAIYFANCKNKRLYLPILISLFACFCSTIFACFICRFI
jgi:spore maturation protein B